MAGGAQATGVTTSETYLDLTALAGYEVMLWSDDQDLWFSWAASAAGTLVISGNSAASKTSLKADRIGSGSKAQRVVSIATPFLVVKTVTSTALVHVKPVRGPL